MISVSSPNLFYKQDVEGYGLSQLANSSFAKTALVDIDGDNDLDLFIRDDRREMLFSLNIGNSESPRFSIPTLNTFGIATEPSFYQGSLSHIFIDFDGDGDFDLISGSANGDLSLLRI